MMGEHLSGSIEKAIGLDVGTTKIKCALVNISGEILYSLSCKTGIIRSPRTGWMEMDPNRILENVIKILGKVLLHLKEEETVIGLSTSAPILIIADGKGVPLRPAILYNDTRSLNEIEELNREFGESFFKINGNRVNVQQWVPKLLWLKRHEQNVFVKAKKFFDLSSYIIWHLTGKHVMDFTVAQDTGLLNYKKRMYSDEIIKYLGIDRECLPELYRTTDIVGNIEDKIIKVIFPKRKMKLFINAGCEDAMASTLSTGAYKPDRLTVVLGSTGIICFSTECPHPSKRIYLGLSPIANLYLALGGTAAAGLFLDFMRNTIFNKIDYSKIEKIAKSSQEGSNGVIILPYIIGERTPIFDPYARGVLFGLRKNTRKSDIARACFESIAYSIYHNLKVFQELGYDADTVYASGGMTKSALMLEILANMLGKKMLRYPKASETLSDAFIAFKSLGKVRNWNEIENWLDEPETLLPNIAKKRVYDQNFIKYVKIYQRLKNLFR
jgi:xylulokinase